MQPAFQVIEDGSGLGLAKPNPLVLQISSRLLLNSVETGYALDRLFGNGRPLRLEHVNKLAPDVGHAGDLTDAA